jgi:glycosyltransferase involved in cell wall biosynthesis
LACRLAGSDARVVFRCCTFPASGLAIQPWHLRLLIPMAYRGARVVIATTRAMQEDLVKTFGVARERIRLLANPVDIKRIRAAADARPSGGAAYLLAMGRLIHDKGFDVLLEAFSRIPQSRSELRLALLGTGPLEHALRDQAQRLGLGSRVDFLGFNPEPWPVVKGARLFLLTSRREGFPNALLEAMALGVPCIAAKCKSGPAEMLRDGETGILVEPEDAAGLAGAMRRLLEDPEGAARMGKQASMEAERYAPEAIARDFVGILRGGDA